MASPVPSDSQTPRKRSPWVYVALGCSLLFVLTVGGCIAGLTIVGQRFYSEVNKPVEPEQVVADLSNVPIYRPSELDIERTKAMRASMALMPFGKPVAASFYTPDQIEPVIEWYREQLPAQGYQPTQSTEHPLGSIGGVTQLQFTKGNKLLMVQSQTNPGDADSGSIFTLVQFQIPQEPTAEEQ